MFFQLQGSSCNACAMQRHTAFLPFHWGSLLLCGLLHTINTSAVGSLGHSRCQAHWTTNQSKARVSLQSAWETKMTHHENEMNINLISNYYTINIIFTSRWQRSSAEFAYNLSGISSQGAFNNEPKQSNTCLYKALKNYIVSKLQSLSCNARAMQGHTAVL